MLCADGDAPPAGVESPPARGGGRAIPERVMPEGGTVTEGSYLVKYMKYERDFSSSPVDEPAAADECEFAANPLTPLLLV